MWINVNLSHLWFLVLLFISAKKEYDAKGTGYLDAGGGLESMSDTELRDATSQMLEK